MPARHLLIGLEQDDTGYPPYTAEELDATELGDDRFRLDVVPSFAFSLAKGDIVRAERYDDQLWIVELLEPSGNSSVRVIGLGGRGVEEPTRALRALGCSITNTLIDRMIAVDIPPAVDFDSVHALLLTGQEASVWDFNVGVRADGGDV